ncbi:MAG: type II toxin-antitoxin system Phd/YefM family antitoxin [Oscillospiraceae bacterium]|jgi:antitoxin Phd|nr:type II toxin-antitoxin system Phd/YefM family antitoxin [Oscillospiraceae bacterium]
MLIDTKNMVSITEANQNFSRVARMVDENGLVVIMRNNRPCYLLLDFSDAEASLEKATDSLSQEELMTMARQILAEHRETFEVLAQ